MWEDVVLPLRETRRVHRSIDACDATNAERYIPLRFDYEGIDVLLLEGIFLFKKQYQDRFDLKVWIDCSIHTAMHRAIQRNQEKMAESEIRWDYEVIYYSAQRLHFEKDKPQDCADVTIRNDE
jgi:uridine kinase